MATDSQWIVAIIGGATAGAEAAGMLAERGVSSVVFEQNARPYGKIEDGLPRWHVRLRQKEYELINSKLDHPNVHFVPLTKIGRDIDFRALVEQWGFSAVVLANGAWRDRPLPVESAEHWIGRGLIYQNPFIYWFNHFTEPDYQGPPYAVEDGAVVVGGGLASVDVLKVLQIETVRLALEKRAIREDMLHIEHAGIPDVLRAHELTWEDLGLKPATLIYRRRIEDMPLAEAAEDTDEGRRKKTEEVRRRILEKAMRKYLFVARPQRVPVEILSEGDRLTGLRVQRTRVEGGRAVAVPEAYEDIGTALVISSIGSIPEPIRGIPQDGILYRFADPELGRLEGYENVFATGNVVTGKGNIALSRRHSIQVSTHVIESFLGLEGNHDGEEVFLERLAAAALDSAERVSDWVRAHAPLEAAAAEALLARVRERQAAVGYTCSYGDWLARVTPPDRV